MRRRCSWLWRGGRMATAVPAAMCRCLPSGSGVLAFQALTLAKIQCCTDMSPCTVQLRRWEEEGGMPVLVGSERFVSRPMSGGYKHPDIIRCEASEVC